MACISWAMAWMRFLELRVEVSGTKGVGQGGDASLSFPQFEGPEAGKSHKDVRASADWE